MRPTREQWAANLRAAAGPVAGGIDLADTFADDAGHRRTVDAPLIAWRRATPAPLPRPDDPPDVRLWSALTNPGVDTEALLARLADSRRSECDDGALTPRQGSTIEVWTETELASIHALSRLAQVRSRPEWATLARAAAAWHVEHIQPDNATAHPWAIHVFVELACTQQAAGAALHAEQLLHACQVSLARPDRLSAIILLDAADALEHRPSSQAPKPSR